MRNSGGYDFVFIELLGIGGLSGLLWSCPYLNWNLTSKDF